MPNDTKLTGASTSWATEYETPTGASG